MKYVFSKERFKELIDQSWKMLSDLEKMKKYRMLEFE